MGRKIILLSDGTGNSAAKVWRTNVWRVFESIDLTKNDQVAYYDDGVGTAAFKPLAVLGGAFGFGLKRNVIDLYKFACRNYRNDDDEIFAFGFSRGAFTIRVLIGLILEQGLVKQPISEAELDAKAKDAYREFRANNFNTKWPAFMRPERLFRWISKSIRRKHYNTADNRPGNKINVRFLGLWDTVAAYGMPIEEMSVGFSRWIWPWMLPNYLLDPGVKRACHALAIDDERTTFHPVLWDERNEKPLLAGQTGKREIGEERISQVWFPGVHSNVGGGYPDDSIAQIPLVWMMAEAARCHLVFKSIPDASPQTSSHAGTAQDKDGRIYDNRQGLGGYYRYGPRDMVALGKELLSRQGGEALPRIHESVFKRIYNRAHAYAPIGLPVRYEVVTATGEVLAPEQNTYETPEQAAARCHLQQKVWNAVWGRRLVYFMTVAVSAYLVAFPLIGALQPEDEYSSKLRWVSDVVRTIAAFLPGALDPWVDGYARDPGRFLIVVAVLTGMLLWSARLASRIQSGMDTIWQGSLGSKLTDPGQPADPIFRFRTHPFYVSFHRWLKAKFAPALFAVLFAYLGVTLSSHVLFNIQDTAGLVCPKSEAKLEGLLPGEIVLANGRTRRLADLEREAQSNPALSDADKRNPFKYVQNLPVFDTKNLCQSMKVNLERNRKYLIRFESTDSFMDDDVPGREGFYSVEAPSLWRKVTMFLGIPLRRELIRPWFRVVARFGSTGGEETFLDPDKTDPTYLISEDVKATRNGELFLFVNDAVIGIPGLYDWFYKNNRGSTKVLIQRR